MPAPTSVITGHAPVCLIDASIYIFRYYFSMPANWFSEPEGHSTEAVYGFTRFLVELLSTHAPSHVAVCFDESLGSGFRHRLSPMYKCSRALPDEALAFQLQACSQVARLLGLASFASEEYEADDLLASLYRISTEGSAPVAVVSRDKDLAQVFCRDIDYLWDYADDRRYFPADIAAKFGVPCHRLSDFQALVGDATDDIDGVPGVGPITAAALLQEGGSLEALLANPEAIAQFSVRGAKSLAVKLPLYRDEIALAQQLVTLVGDIPLVAEVNDLCRKDVKTSEFSDFCAKMGWTKTMASRLLSSLDSLNQPVH